MTVRNLCAAAIIASSAAFAAEAATYPTFVLDTSASTIDVTQNSGCTFFSCATLSGTFGAGATGFNWTPTSPTDSVGVSDFFNWSVSGAGIEGFSVAVTLAFSSPESVVANGSGSGWFKTLFGVVSGGKLVWDTINPVVFADGSQLDIAFDNVHAFGFGNSTTSGATFTGNTIAAVPLPASVPMLAAGLVALGALRRRKKDGLKKAA
ncbi:VPLPA-CTERM sorting domain-containing protein [Phaeovulum sp.]|uniref:VPLPA-CTERM sorting domain-containing protein n=1 Tax=Phaeovulum sp. TaxID=2934796 RepID=UPI0039E3B1CC